MTGSDVLISPATPAHAPLARFVGQWTTRGVLRESDSEAGGVVEATDTYEWLPGGYFLLHRWDARFPGSRTQGIELIGYDASSRDFFMQSFDSDGNTGLMRATVEGDNWSFLSDSLRFNGAFGESGATFSGLWEQRTADDMPWTPWMEITLRKNR